MSTGITHITSAAQLDKLLEASGGNLTVIDFHATWCGPCHAIAPKFEALSKEYPSVSFLKCDVDACQEVARRYTVTAMPTFLFLKNGAKIDQVRGANPSALQQAIQKHATPGSAGGAFTGKGQTLGGAPAPAAEQAKDFFSNIDPQVALLIVMGGIYLAYLYFQ